MRIRTFIRVGILALFLALASSCVTTRQVAYLQDMTHESQIELENRFEAVICPYDELDIYITCFDKELAIPFNLRSGGQGIRGSNQQNLYYLVDQYGNVELPVLGVIQAAGLTRLKLQDKIREMLVKGNYLNDPFVMVRFRDFKVFFLGSNGGKAITINNERCTFLEALALSGDLNVYTNRSKIAVMREVDGKMVTRYLDPRSSEVFKDPFFMLQQNDFIITQNTGYRNFQQSYSQFGTILSAISTLTGIATTYFAIMAYRNSNK